MKFISQRNIALLCYSSNMAAANTLYTGIALGFFISYLQFSQLSLGTKSVEINVSAVEFFQNNFYNYRNTLEISKHPIQIWHLNTISLKVICAWQ